MLAGIEIGLTAGFLKTNEIKGIEIGIHQPKLIVKIQDKDANVIEGAVLTVNGVKTISSPQGIAIGDFDTGKNANIKVTKEGMIDVEFVLFELTAVSLIIPMFKQNDVYLSSLGTHVNLKPNRIDNIILG